MYINEKNTLERVWWLVRYEVQSRYRIFRRIFLLFVVFMLLPCILRFFDIISLDDCSSMMLNMLVGALSVASCGFLSRLSKKTSRIQYLMLPCRMSEKLLSQLLVYTVGLLLLVLVAAVVTSVIVEAFNYVAVSFFYVSGGVENFADIFAGIFSDNGSGYPGRWRVDISLTLLLCLVYSFFVNLRCRDIAVGRAIIVCSLSALIAALLLVFIIDNFMKEVVLVEADGTLHSTVITANIAAAVTYVLLSAAIFYLWYDSLRQFKLIQLV